MNASKLETNDASSLTASMSKKSPALLRSGRKLVQVLLEEVSLDPEARAYPRHPVAIDAIAIPLDSSTDSVHEPFDITTLDISMIGLSFCCAKPPASDLLRIDFSPSGRTDLTRLVQVISHRVLGHLHRIGGVFIEPSED